MTSNSDDQDPYVELARTYKSHPRPNRRPEQRYDPFLLFLSFAVAFSVLMGGNSSLDGEGVARNALVLFLGILAGALSLQANKAAFHVGSKLASSGDWFAIVLVIGWFCTMAVVVGTIGFAGVSREIVEGAILREPIQAIATASRQVNEAASSAKRVIPLIQGGANDIQGIASCESVSGCVSGRRGRGPEVASLEALAAKFRDVARQYEAADRRRADLAKALEKLSSKYEAQLSKGGASGSSRAALLGIYTEAQSLMTEIGNAVPTAATQGLVSELRGIRVSAPKPGRIDVGARLRGHADRLEEALAGITSSAVELPPFPAPSGMAVGWERLDLTWPLAVLLFGLEIILVVLWLLLVRDFAARRRSLDDKDDDRDEPPAPPAKPLLGGDSARRQRPVASVMIGRHKGDS